MNISCRCLPKVILNIFVATKLLGNEQELPSLYVVTYMQAARQLNASFLYNLSLDSGGDGIGDGD